MEFYIFEFVWVQNFNLTNNFEFLDQIYPKKVIPAQNRKSSPRA